MRAQDLEELLDPTYIPSTPDEVKNFRMKQAFGFQVLQKKVQTPTGKAIVEAYKTTFNAQKVLQDLSIEAVVSTQAILSNRQMLEKMILTRFDPRSSKISAVDFIVRFDQMMRTYNEQQLERQLCIPDLMKKTYLQGAVSHVSMLKAVHHRELEKVVQEGEQAFFTYEQYLTVVKGVATTYDECVSGRRTTSANMAAMSYGDPDTSMDEPPDCESEIQEYVANVMRRRMGGAAMNKETWESISEEGKKTWDQMSATDKRNILQYAMKRAEKPEKEKISANKVEFDTEIDDEISLEEEEKGEDVDTMDVNNATTDAKKGAHPGDPRRMMSGKGKGSAKKVRSVKTAMFTKPSDQNPDIDDILERYWNQDYDSDEEPDFPRGD
jgi:hypothetical protein